LPGPSSFACSWKLENRVNLASFEAMPKRVSEHPIDQIAAKLRGMMPWIKESALVDRACNSSARAVRSVMEADPRGPLSRSGCRSKVIRGTP